MIHFSINKNLFLQALNTTKRAISSKNAIPILSTIKIDQMGKSPLKILFLKRIKMLVF